MGGDSAEEELTDSKTKMRLWKNGAIKRKAHDHCPQTENVKSTGRRREWKNKEHTKVDLTVLILYNTMISYLIRTSMFPKTHGEIGSLIDLLAILRKNLNRTILCHIL